MHPDPSVRPFVLSALEREAIEERVMLYGIGSAAVSSLILLQLQWMFESRTWDPHQVTDEIRSIEEGTNATGTKRASQFRHPPLEGLWHKHFFQDQFMVENIRLHWGMERAVEGRRSKLRDMIDRECAGLEVFTPEVLRRIPHLIVEDGVFGRGEADKLTGEWIIFKEHCGRRYYLTLASHVEDNQAIYARILAWCQPEFPDLFSKPSAGGGV